MAPIADRASASRPVRIALLGCGTVGGGVVQLLHANADYLASRGRLAAPGFTATSFALMSARDGVGGGPYVAEAEFPLG